MPSKLNLTPSRSVRPSRALPRTPIGQSLNLSPVRRTRSLDLDDREIKQRGAEDFLPLPPYLHWPAFQKWFGERWKVGEHVAAVGETGSGKTTFCRNVLQMRSFAVVLGTKSKDEDLYPALEALGFVRTDTWNPWEYEETHERYVIFAPPLDVPDDATERDLLGAEEEQAGKFRTALIQVNKAGGWCVYSDEIATITNDMGLKRTVNLLYREARSKSLTLIASTQRPREVPLNIFQQAKWFILWQISDRDDRYRAAQYAGQLMPIVDYTCAQLPRFEFLCLHKPTGEIVRSRVGG